ncbi:MAG: YicC/YloC family endoribonuclease [Gammaproteobacteria bacterium]
MIKSMTGFARREARHELGALTIEVRSVNHRYLEVGLRLPEEFRALETPVRERVAGHLARGKVDVGLKLHKSGRVVGHYEIDKELLKTLGEAVQTLGDDWPAPLQAATTLDLMRWPGVVNEVARDLAPLQDAALALLDDTLQDLIDSRAREGERLKSMLLERLDGVSEQVLLVRARMPEVNAGLLQKMRDRVSALDVTADDARLEQEVALLAQKADVAEELDRLDSHIAEGRAALALDEPVGRRLDFLMQEFNREANTLASKSQDAQCTKASVELKVLIEQMREQVQNVE